MNNFISQQNSARGKNIEAGPPSTDADGDAVTMSALRSLLEEHKNSLQAAFETSIATLESKLDTVQASVADHGQRIVSLESNANSVSDHIEALETTCVELKEANARLQARLLDQQARSQRWNARIVGLSESTPVGPRPTEFFSSLLVQVLGADVLPQPPQLEIAHRALRDKPGPSEKPRHVIMRFSSLPVKEQVIKEARKRRADLKYKGNKIAIYEDLPAAIMEERRLYRDVMAQLYQLGLKPSLRHPARLFITEEDGNKLRLDSVDDAKKYISAKKHG